MANDTISGLKITLKYAKGAFSFKDIIFTASETQMYNLAYALNAFQVEPPVKVICTTTKDIM